MADKLALSIDDFHARYIQPAIEQLAKTIQPLVNREMKRRGISRQVYAAMPKEEQDILRADMIRVLGLDARKN